MIALIESRPYQDQRGGDFDPRVSAVTERTRRLLDGCGLWDAIARERICGYTKMEVWDAEGTGRVRFNCADLGASNLGHIVENCVLQGAAIDALDDYENVILYCPEIVQNIAPALADGSTVVQLSSGEALCTRLLIGADGAASQVRRASGLATREWDYRQSAIVACETARAASSRADGQIRASRAFEVERGRRAAPAARVAARHRRRHAAEQPAAASRGGPRGVAAAVAQTTKAHTTLQNLNWCSRCKVKMWSRSSRDGDTVRFSHKTAVF